MTAVSISSSYIYNVGQKPTVCMALDVQQTKQRPAGTLSKENHTSCICCIHNSV